MATRSLLLGTVILIIVAAGAIYLVDAANVPVATNTQHQSSQTHSGLAPTTTGQPVVIVTATNLPASIPATGRNNLTIACQKPSASSYGTITVSNQGTGSVTLKFLVIQYPAFSPYATVYLAGQSCNALSPNSTTTIYVTGLPAAAQSGSYYDGWFVLTSGAETNVFSGQFA
jgi:hypothetical protein